jgi:CRP-like cAMP-binding protein
MIGSMASPIVSRREMLARITIFSDLRPDEIDLLLAVTATRRLKPREVLFRKGDPGSQLYGVLTGRLRVSTSGADGKEIVFGYHEPGEVFGEIALLDSDPRSATIEAVEPSELMTLHRRDLIPFLEKHPRVAISLAGVLARRIRRLSEVMEDARFLSLESRLAKKLVHLARTYGRKDPSGVRIDLRLRQHELGELVGVSRESVNKQLRAWGQEGLVRFERGYITVLDPEGLEALARLVLF